ncbi:flagellar basal-body rod modification protein FlgD [Acidovorax soli]|jgi:flagellar basal-body rod modification protein FlgD|uniref:Basal-body rod modification protein FlgD n=1 Tax=Acidovorax soli TaxID=592050 RepID=A0A7X0PJ50_9BURK|nr:flagellar hook capping FlgD N-terminal domain-containing protein [Acidovorax soli]MBB6562534.1 flagellar basal-body rod modification protein FlgD [Acidovorax soli]
METNSTSSATQGSGATGSNAISSALGGGGSVSDLFVKLLVAQIRNQNPLEPTDPSEFVGQLTQLSQMEALQKLTEQGTTAASLMASTQMLTLGSQVGSSVTVQTDTLAVNGQPIALGFHLNSNSAQTTLVLTGSDGARHRVELGTHNTGDVKYTLDPTALGLAPGKYGVQVETSTQEAPAIEVTGELTNVRLTGSGSALLTVAGADQVQPGLITAFNGKPATATP